MATKSEGAYESGVREVIPGNGGRVWKIYGIRGYATIAARKHGLMTPTDNEALDKLTDSEIDALFTLVRDLAHLPPA